MRHYSVKANKNIFTAYAGLTVSGYNLAENSCAKDIINSIRKIKYDKDIIDYFKKLELQLAKLTHIGQRLFYYPLQVCL